jgi:hypothetical protein
MVRGSGPVIFRGGQRWRVRREWLSWRLFFVEIVQTCSFGSLLVLFFEDMLTILVLLVFLNKRRRLHPVAEDCRLGGGHFVLLRDGRHWQNNK